VIAEVLPVERVAQGDVVVLPGGREVNVEAVVAYDHGLVVRWWRDAERGEPGDRTRGGNGRYLGSLKPLQPGDGVLVRR
jgi:hypothetical protein